MQAQKTNSEVTNRAAAQATESSKIEKVVDVVNGKPMLKAVAKKTVKTKAAHCGSKVRTSNFDFAGVAG